MKKKKDILFLCQFFYPEYISSATLPFDTAQALTEEGFKVGALCGYPKEYNLRTKVPSKETYENIEIKRLKYLQLGRGNFIGRLVNYFSFTFSVMLNFWKLRSYKSIIVYSNPPVLPLIAALANKFFKTRVVFVSYDVYPEIAYKTNSITKESFIGKMMTVINKVIFKRVTKVVALSTEMKRYLLENRPNLVEHDVEIIPNWYKEDVNQKKVITTNSLFYSLNQEKELIVSYFGNMGVAQDMDTIIEAIRQLEKEDKIHFIFAGHGSKMDMLKEIVTQEELKNISIFDYLHGNDFQDALDVSDCFVVSLAEGLNGLAVPSKTYSYMMAGKPVLAIMDESSDIAKDLINNEAGFALKVGESKKLASAIKELRSNEEKRKVMGRNCKQVFLEKYTQQHCTQQYINMMQKVLEDS